MPLPKKVEIAAFEVFEVFIDQNFIRKIMIVSEIGRNPATYLYHNYVDKAALLEFCRSKFYRKIMIIAIGQS
jgi:hypothetical protein